VLPHPYHPGTRHEEKITTFGGFFCKLLQTIM